MQFLAWLFSRAPHENSPAPEVALPVEVFNPPDQQALAEIDARDEVEFQVSISISEPHRESIIARREAETAPLNRVHQRRNDARDPSVLADLADTFCIIEYCDSGGTSTRRRVTLQKMKSGPHAPLIQAVCHERRAVRTFRSDRITAVITEDGEVVPALQFFQNTYGADVAVILNPKSMDDDDTGEIDLTGAAAKLTEAVRPGLAILIGAARADKNFHPMELDVIEVYIEDEAIALHREGFLPSVPTHEELARLTKQVRRMRPQFQTLNEHVTAVSQWPTEKIARLAKTLSKVIRADGVIRQDEADFVDEFRRLSKKAARD